MEFYYRIESNLYPPEDIKGDKRLAYEVAEEVEEKVMDMEPDDYSYPIHCVRVKKEGSVVSVEGYVLDADEEVYNEEDWDEFPYHEYNFTFEWEDEEEDVSVS